MDKHIAAEAAVETFRLWFERIGTKPSFEDVQTIIQQVPAADVEPVRHGRWKLEPTNPYDDPGYKNRMIKRCSCCGWQNACRYNYCPNCGAHMDGEA